MVSKHLPRWQKLPSFRWRKISDEWTCTLHGRILSLKQDPSHLHYKVMWPDRHDSSKNSSHEGLDGLDGADDGTAELLRRYFSLHLNLGTLYRQWSEADSNFQRKAPQFTGVRILSQDAWEALVCFICSSNNNISRISQMVHKLCNHYGPLIGHVEDVPMHDFPTPKALIGKGVESHLRELGFGYRAKYIAETARTIALEKPANWLDSLRNPRHSCPRDVQVDPVPPSPTYKEAHEALLSLTGVGPKVADCVCLMGLGWGQSVPVDTHVWQIAQRDYKFGKSKVKTFNKVMYDAVGDHFREIWGDYAGWAHSVLFTADLKDFASRKERQGGSLPGLAKEEAKEEEEILRSGRKRRAKVEAVMKIDTKVEEIGGATIIGTTTAYKRRRVRQRV
ncbi:DNA glycosylase [Moelleriella libera RCEF 2490]|uniref:DNA-(apurinic or apyrimidinic site) lyase n=1 Tax=Moelleriella libera RCEF 2490 TaxID=1081109 RepID=A0A166UP25_9HYPO|nr:DNA glycosylase [Moelleriella libera RCEF 2490]